MKLQKRWISLVLALMLVMSSAVLTTASAAPDFEVTDGILTKYNGTATTITAADLEGAKVTVIGADAFKGNKKITSVVLPNTVTAIHPSSFEGCTKLTSITLPTNKAFTTIPNKAFKDCAALEKIVIPQYVASIGDYAFQNCISLDLVEGYKEVKNKLGMPYKPVGSAVISMGTGVFDNCPYVVVSCYKGSAVETFCINQKVKYESLDPLVEKITAGQEIYVAVYDKTTPGTVTITATIEPDIAASAQLGWSSSNVLIATVNESGVVTAKGPGTCTVTIKGDDVNNYETSVKVVVLDDTKTWQQWDGVWYYCKSASSYAVGWEQISGKWYYFNEFGQMLDGWQKIGGYWYYLTPGNGVMHTGWLKLGTQWFYLNADGPMQTGWLQLGSTWYYFEPGKSDSKPPVDCGYMYTGSHKIDNVDYLFAASGALMGGTGWHQSGSNWYYSNASGLVKGWLQVKGVWYYMDPGTGAMKTGWQTIKGIKYYFNGSGAMVTGWQKLGSAWYWFASSGAMQTGWLQQGSTWYFLDKATGEMLTGWHTIDGVTYYFAGSGAMVTGWQKLGSTWYYFAKSGAMHTGWLQQGSTWYYLMPGTGAMVTGTQVIDGKTYTFASSGAMQ